MPTPFTSYAFTASAPLSQGITADRALPDRYNDVINVKDWGAKGDGITDDTTAINNAIAYAYSINATYGPGTTVFIPPGTYNIATPPLQFGKVSKGFDGCLNIMGAGRTATIIKGNSTGFIAIKGGGSSSSSWHGLQNLTIQNDSTAATGGALYLGYCDNNPYIDSCNFTGFVGLFQDSPIFGIAVRNCRFSFPGFAGATNFYPASNSPHGPPTNCIGCQFRQGILWNCYAEGFDVGFLIFGVPASISSCKAYRCNTGFQAGFPGSVSGGGVVNYSYTGNHTERCKRGFSISTTGASGMNVIAHDIMGTDGVTDAATITSITPIGGGNVRATTTVAHNLSVGTFWLLLVTNPAGWTPNGTGQQIISCTNSGSNTFDYALASPSGSFTSATWNYPLEYGIVGQNAGGSEQLFAANSLRSAVLYGSFAYQHSGSPGQDKSNVVMATSGPGGIWLPTSPDGPNWEFIQCGAVGAPSVPYGFLHFSDLNPQVIDGYTSVGGAFEGREYNIIDAQLQGGFAGIVAGGGSNNHYKVRFNGTKWIRIG
jgi:hypothetical protein